MSDRSRIAYVDGPRLRRALLAACRSGRRCKAELNRINVFPVADGDTGTNLSLTLEAVAGELAGSRERRVDRVAALVARSAQLGARGNCGMMLLHTDHPREAIDYCATLGTVVAHKAEDMLAQYEAARDARGKARGAARAKKLILDTVAAAIPPDVKKVRFGVIHVAAPEMADLLRSELAERYGGAEILVAPITPVIAARMPRGFCPRAASVVSRK